ncbi:MAG: macro domain-containing protein [Clostridia bacterium]|nr:macro domain-containing protein [Clostridia bacterium]MBQ1434525.1 macro domain-containing protein [Clostridia bacterium]
MAFKTIHGDITKVHADAIVNAANSRLLPGGGVCGAIFRAAGYKELSAECEKTGHCDTGRAVITGAYALPAKYVIHAVGPIWNGGESGEEELLYGCYESALNLAKEHGCASVAFPLISAGIYGYPREAAMDVARRAIEDFLSENEMDVYLVLFG